jgi:RNA polymerase sigma-70 factor (ECF subfamily)
MAPDPARDGGATATADAPVDLDRQLERHRVELTGYCYRMLGSAFEAEDAVQETMVRAWRSYDRFEGRSSLRTWLYRIATNVCLDHLDGRQRRARPVDLGPARSADGPVPEPVAGESWVEPMPDARVFGIGSGSGGDPADSVASRESIRLAFIAALQYLPPRQRAVLVLREVLAWHADEVAELLDTSVASVNSALQRARATLASRNVTESDPLRPMDPEQQLLLSRYLRAFEAYDMDALLELVHAEATSSMPPYEMWLQGATQIRDWMIGPGAECEGSRLVPTVANGVPAFGQYRPSGPGGRHEPWSLQVLEINDGKITGFNFFLDPELFPLFGLPAHPDDADGRHGTAHDGR